MNTANATLTFNEASREWELASPEWDRVVTFLTHDAAADYVARNRIVIATAVDQDDSTGQCFFCGEAMDGKHEDDCPQANHVSH